MFGRTARSLRRSPDTLRLSGLLGGTGPLRLKLSRRHRFNFQQPLLIENTSDNDRQRRTLRSQDFLANLAILKCKIARRKENGNLHEILHLHPRLLQLGEHVAPRKSRLRSEIGRNLAGDRLRYLPAHEQQALRRDNFDCLRISAGRFWSSWRIEYLDFHFRSIRAPSLTPVCVWVCTVCGLYSCCMSHAAATHSGTSVPVRRRSRPWTSSSLKADRSRVAASATSTPSVGT